MSDTSIPISSEYPLPTDFLKRFEERFGKEETEALLNELVQEPPISIRLHPLKCKVKENVRVAGVPWCRTGIYLKERPSFITDPLWHAGGYYVQEASSMIIAYLIERYCPSPSVVLDLCAAPGGKTTLLRDTLPCQSILIANEPDASRSNILWENVLRHGSSETIVTRATPRELCKSGLVCDLILVDAPCSGEGMFRKYPHSRQEWSVENILMCAKRQREILDEAWEMLAPGGILLYSTCTYSIEENEQQYEYLKAKGGIAHPLADIEEIIPGIFQDIEGCLHLFPHRVKGEGLSICMVQKRGEYVPFSPPKSSQKCVHFPVDLPQGTTIERVIRIDKSYVALSDKAECISHRLEKSGVRILSAGVTLATQKGKSLIPNHAWIMSPELRQTLPYPTLSLTEQDVLTYLSRETLRIGREKGLLAMTYRDVLLGWGKGIGSRINNLYPKELGIRRSLTQTETPSWIPCVETLSSILPK